VVGNISKNNQQVTAGSGIFVRYSDYCAIIGNSCYDDQVTPTQPYGLRIQGSYATVVGNSCKDNALLGILIQKSNCVIIGNVSEGNSHDGVRIDSEVDYCLIKDNILMNNGGYGVRIMDVTCDENVIEGNRLIGNTTGALRDDGTNTRIRGNIGYLTENSGVVTFSGDGTTKIFNIPSHGLALTPTDRTKIKAYGTPQSTDAENASPLNVYPADLDGDGNYEGLKIVFAEAPVAGTDNVKVTWYAEL